MLIRLSRKIYGGFMRLFQLSLFALLFLSCSQNYKYSGPEYTVIENVTIIDGLGNPPISNKFIVVKDSIIVQIGDIENKNYGNDVNLICGNRRYIIPGLVDLHAHVTVLPLTSNGYLAESIDTNASFQSLKTILDYGITTVRNPAAPTSDGIWLREQVKNGMIAGPRIYTAGEALNRTAARFGPFIEADTFKKIETAIEDQAKKGVDFIKVYSSLKPELIEQAINYAHEKKLKVIGHLQRTSWSDAATFGIDFISHAAPWSIEYLPVEEQNNYSGTFLRRLDWIEHINLSKGPIIEMADLLAENEVILDPTLIALHTKFWGDDPIYLESPHNKISHQTILEVWNNGTFVDRWKENDFARAKTLWPKVQRYVQLLFNRGVFLAAGSDFPNPWVNPGISLHQELKLLRDCGIPAPDVIRIATYNGAKALGIENKLGSIEEGKIADLIILSKNPLIDISNTQKIDLVFKDGVVIK